MSNDECHTPDEFFDKLAKYFNFTLDAAATAKNTKCKKFITKEQDAFKTKWYTKGFVWLNPPFSKEAGGSLKWLERASQQYELQNCLGVVALTICDVSTKAAQFGWDYADEIVFLSPRINFASPGKTNRKGGEYAYCLYVFNALAKTRSKMSRWNWKDQKFNQRSFR